MPVKKRKSKARQHLITDEVVALFCKCCEIQKFGDEEFWAEEGGRRREYLDASRDLCRLLGLPPWHASPLDTDLAGPAPYNPEGCWAVTRPAALEIRREILAAMGAAANG
jgi:hypothetical protein